MTPDYGRMVTRLEAMFVPVFFEGVRTVGNAAASPEMSVFSSWVSVARDALQTPRGLKVRSFVEGWAVSLASWIFRKGCGGLDLLATEKMAPHTSSK